MTWGGLDLTSFEETNQASQWLVKNGKNVEMARADPCALPWADAMQGKVNLGITLIGNVGARGDTAQAEFHYYPCCGQSLTTLTTTSMNNTILCKLSSDFCLLWCLFVQVPLLSISQLVPAPLSTIISPSISEEPRRSSAPPEQSRILIHATQSCPDASWLRCHL